MWSSKLFWIIVVLWRFLGLRVIMKLSCDWSKSIKSGWLELVKWVLVVI